MQSSACHFAMIITCILSYSKCWCSSNDRTTLIYLFLLNQSTKCYGQINWKKCKKNEQIKCSSNNYKIQSNYLTKLKLNLSTEQVRNSFMNVEYLLFSHRGLDWKQIRVNISNWNQWRTYHHALMPERRRVLVHHGVNLSVHTQQCTTTTTTIYYLLRLLLLLPLPLPLLLLSHVGTGDASRFDSNPTIPIQLESDGLIRNSRISRTCRHSVLPQTTLTVPTKKLQPLRRFSLDLFYVYDFMFM